MLTLQQASQRPEAALRTCPTHGVKQRSPAGLALQPGDALVIKAHAQDVVSVGQNADVLEGEVEVLLVPQLEGVQAYGLLHTALHHVPREGGGLRQQPVVEWLDLGVACREEEHRHCHSRLRFHVRFRAKCQRRGGF